MITPESAEVQSQKIHCNHATQSMNQLCYLHVTWAFLKVWGTGIRCLIRGMATLPQGNQKLLEVNDKVGRPQASLGWSSQWNVIFSLQCFGNVGWAQPRFTWKNGQ